MVTRLLLLGWLLSWSAGGGAQEPCLRGGDDALRVMTYNIRVNVASDGDNAWPHRRDRLAAQVLFHAPDILGVQEAFPDQKQWLDRHLTGYASVGEGREGGDRGEYTAIYYNRRRLGLVRSGGFWLSDTPDRPSVGWDAAFPRLVSWGRFREYRSGKDFLVFNAHFDHRGREARRRSADRILHAADSLAGSQELPYLVLGDLNLTPDTEPIRKLTAALTDAFVASPRRLGPAETFSGFDATTPPRRRIDYVLASPGVRVTGFATLTDVVGGRYPSDHLPVLSTLLLRPRPLVIAHRGASGYALENSLDAFRRAVDLGADVIELDVFALRDSSVVCFHDGGLRRLTGTEGKITDYDLAELRQLTLRDGSRIPLLRDVLQLVDKRLRINVELKGPGTARPTYAIVREFIRDHGWQLGDFHISSFRHDELRTMRALDADIEIGILPHGGPVAAIPVGRELGAHSINAHHAALNADNVAALRQAGFAVYAWTVNAAADISRLLELGIDGFITNYPDRVQRIAAE